MKQTLRFSILVLGLAFVAIAWKKPPVIKVYAFAQPVSSGVRQNSVTADGSDQEIKMNAKQSMNYFFFLEYKRSKDIRPVYVWINNKLYTVQAEEVQTPVRLQSADQVNSEKDILVPRTKHKVLKLTLAGEASENNFSAEEKKNAAVIMYKCRKKTHYVTIDEVKVLEAATMM